MTNLKHTAKFWKFVFPAVRRKDLCHSSIETIECTVQALPELHLSLRMARQSSPGDPASASAPPAAWALLQESLAQKAAPFPPPPPRRRNTPRSSQLGPRVRKTLARYFFAFAWLLLIRCDCHPSAFSRTCFKQFIFKSIIFLKKYYITASKRLLSRFFLPWHTAWFAG